MKGKRNIHVVNSDQSETFSEQLARERLEYEQQELYGEPLTTEREDSLWVGIQVGLVITGVMWAGLYLLFEVLLNG